MAQLSNRDIIIRLLKSDLSDYDNLLSLLGMANEVLSEDKELSKKLANKVRFLALRLCSTGDIKYYNLYNQALEKWDGALPKVSLSDGTDTIVDIGDLSSTTEVQSNE